MLLLLFFLLLSRIGVLDLLFIVIVIAVVFVIVVIVITADPHSCHHHYLCICWGVGGIACNTRGGYDHMAVSIAIVIAIAIGHRFSLNVFTSLFRVSEFYKSLLTLSNSS